MLSYVLHSVCQGFYVKLCITLCVLGLSDKLCITLCVLGFYVKLCITLCALGFYVNYVSRYVP